MAVRRVAPAAIPSTCQEHQALTGPCQLATVEIRPALPLIGQKVPALTPDRRAWSRSSRRETEPRAAVYVRRFVGALNRIVFVLPG
jgi:hypothetical protein